MSGVWKMRKSDAQSIVSRSTVAGTLFRNIDTITALVLPNLAIQDLTLAKVDGYQGYQNHIVILDFVMTDQPGFLNEMNRLVVALSRARDGLYVLANKTAWDKFKKNSKRHMSKMVSRLLPYRCFLEEIVTCLYFNPDQVDLRGIMNYEDNVEQQNIDVEDNSNESGEEV